MGTLAAHPPGGLHGRANALEFFDDFTRPGAIGSGLTPGADGFADVVGDAGSSVSIAISTRTGDRFQETTSDNEEVYSFTDDFWHPYSNGDCGVIGCVDQTSTSDPANIIFGLLGGTIGENMMLDDGGGPVVGVNQALIWKVDGEEFWRCGASLAADANPNHLSNTRAGRLNAGTFSYQSLMIRCTGAGRQISVAYFVDIEGRGGFQPLCNHRNRAIVDRITLASGTFGSMSLVFGLKQGSASALVAWWDWVGGWNSRRRPPIGD